jgi:hypothetical protein
MKRTNVTYSVPLENFIYVPYPRNVEEIKTIFSAPKVSSTFNLYTQMPIVAIVFMMSKMSQGKSSIGRLFL